MRAFLFSRSLKHALVGILAAVCLSYTLPNQPTLASASSAEGIQHDGVRIAADGAIHLQPGVLSPPLAESNYQHYGFFISPIQTFATPTFDVRLSYRASVPSGAALRVDLRVSADGQTWTAWETDQTDGATLSFPHAVRLAQYRARLYAGATAGPVLQAVTVQPFQGPARYTAMQDTTAPTYRIRATRLGMIGGRTANGHIIRPRDHFVALPSWRSLSSRGGHEYQVRITYNGRSAVAPVWDVGPWNTRDNYWSPQRERFPELRLGWPQDHAAYFEGHNGGYAEKGYVRFPTAMDVADGIWWDKLGIHGDQAEVEVTFLWLGRDPHAAPAPPAEVVADEDGPAVRLSRVIWHHAPNGCGENGHAFWTLTTTSAQESKHSVRWQPQLPAAGLYDVYVHVPLCAAEYPVTTGARYQVQHRDGTATVTVDQSQQHGWVLLGQFPFAADASGFIELRNLAGDSRHTIWFDDAKWVPAGSS